ncbi:MAG: 3-isopropylmalate dehydratase small subunit [Actinobacteria bacterium]|nr:3-isopropylmalate dehydratase small subunit [Actinomycetota bacterium]
MPRAWVYGDNVDTDVIIPARYLLTTDPVVLGKHVLEDLDPSFATSVAPGDVVVAGHNFGCGSSREHAPLALKGAGVGAVVAASFARIFFRNAINVGLPILTCVDAAEAIETGDEVALDPETGDLLDPTRDRRFCGERLPDFVTEIVESGGLVEWVKHRLELAR